MKEWGAVARRAGKTGAYLNALLDRLVDQGEITPDSAALVRDLYLAIQTGTINAPK